MRALAVILVLLCHFAPIQSAPWLDSVRRIGWVGVDIFFVLSGFLITRILLKARDNPSGYYSVFYKRRALRIFPLYYALVTVLLVVMFLSKGGLHQYHDMRANWGHPAWLYAFAGNVNTAVSNVFPPWVFVPMWSLHVEEQFYLIFPFLVRRLRPQQLERFLIGAVVAAPLIRLALYWQFPTLPLLQYMLLPCRMDALAFGALVGIRWPNRLPMLGRRNTVVLTSVAVVVALLGFELSGASFDATFTRTIGYSLFGLAFTGCLILVLMFRGHASTSWLNWKPLQFVGLISYGLYLFQTPASALASKLWRVIYGGSNDAALNWEGTTSWALTVAVICFALATASWYLWETPWLSLKSRSLRVSKPQIVADDIPSTSQALSDSVS